MCSVWLLLHRHSRAAAPLLRSAPPSPSNVQLPPEAEDEMALDAPPPASGGARGARAGRGEAVDTLPALSLCEPFGSALLDRLKRAESRSTPMLRGYNGRDVAIRFGQRPWHGAAPPDAAQIEAAPGRLQHRTAAVSSA